ncbi:hypothetical protein [Kribbella rubisoli]|uniref:hypothetical protein n=1 Tax=Kribbella rubisoli TaxID=3075929 RepID=UPI00102C9950|nr:hypothetical protein [Kribbella rubisoli]
MPSVACWSSPVSSAFAAAAADLVLTAEDIERLDTMKVVGEREQDISDNWLSGVTPPLSRLR